MGKSADTPSAPTLGQDINDVIKALPSLYGASSTWNPLFSGLNMTQLNDVLFGTEGGDVDYTTTVSQAGWYDAQGNYLGADKNLYGGGPRHTTMGNHNQTAPNSTAGAPEGVRWIGKGGTISGTRNMAASPGLLAIYGNALSGVRGANRSANPDTYALLEKLTSSANSDLALGNQLSPAQLRLAQQASRSAAAARGMGTGPADILNETFTATGYGDQLEAQRKAWAAQVLGLDQSFANNEISQAMNLVGSNAGTLSSSNPINGLLGLAHDNSMTAYNAAASANIANANNANATTGAVIGGGALIGGALIL